MGFLLEIKYMFEKEDECLALPSLSKMFFNRIAEIAALSGCGVNRNKEQFHATKPRRVKENSNSSVEVSCQERMVYML